MLVIPAGTFLMGSKADPFEVIQPSPDEQPQRSVSLPSFALGKFEVTQEQWFSVMGTTPSFLKGRSLPVEQVSWNDAQEFVKKLNQKTGKQYKLPSEAEWEYAARGGSPSAFSFGDTAIDVGRYAWFNRNSGNKTNPVGEKLPNNFGLYDMHGNVSEFTQDCWNNNYSGAPQDGSAWTVGNCSMRVLRGGSWLHPIQGLRSANRGWLSPAVRELHYGFRVARILD
jgi:formylglycine-generating enzyme required for sulfatase activity